MLRIPSYMVTYKRKFILRNHQGFFARGETHIVCKLNKNIYGLKHSSRAWFDKWIGILPTFGFKQYHYDHSIFCEI